MANYEDFEDEYGESNKRREGARYPEVCPVCGANNPDRSDHCPNCDAELPEEVDTKDDDYNEDEVGGDERSRPAPDVETSTDEDI
jgi:hypothetical protein